MMRGASWLIAALLGVAFASPAKAAPTAAPPPEKTDKSDKPQQGDQADKKPDEHADKGKTDKPDEHGDQKKPATDKPAPGEKSAATGTGSANPETKSTGSDTSPPPEEPEDEEKPPPPPPPPRADEQEPRPYRKAPPPDKPTRMVEIGPHAGVEYLPAKGSGIAYGPGFAWGAHARIEIASWMGFRVSFTNSEQPVTVDDGGLGLSAGTHVDQPTVGVLLLRARIEPTWVVSPRFRAWAGVGAGWGRISAPAPTTSGTEAGIHAADRKGVMLEFSGELGASFDVIPNWLAASLMVSGGALTNQSGKVFTPSQAFTADGHRFSLDGLPHFGSSLSALFGLGLLL